MSFVGQFYFYDHGLLFSLVGWGRPCLVISDIRRAPPPRLSDIHISNKHGYTIICNRVRYYLPNLPPASTVMSACTSVRPSTTATTFGAVRVSSGAVGKLTCCMLPTAITTTCISANIISSTDSYIYTACTASGRTRLVRPHDVAAKLPILSVRSASLSHRRYSRRKCCRRCAALQRRTCVRSASAKAAHVR